MGRDRFFLGMGAAPTGGERGVYKALAISGPVWSTTGMSGQGFSIAHGPGRWAMVGVLGALGVGALAWSLATRGRAEPASTVTKQETVQVVPVLPQPPPVLVARPDVVTPRAETAKAEEKPVASAPEPPEPSKPVAALPLAPTPRVVDRTPHGPAVGEGGSEKSPPTIERPATETAPPPAAKPAPKTETPTDALVTPRMVNVNTASKAELELLPGIGPAMADRIIEARAKQRFADFDDLDKVRGIGPKLLEKLRPRVVFADALPRGK
jgi:competence ComEA-like helix-hairpin-helix protein